MTKYDKNKGRVREKYQKSRRTAAIVFMTMVILFVSFFLYMGFHENVSVFSPRYSSHYGTIINLSPETVQDDTAPMGTRTVYSWLMDAHCETGDYLCFYVSNNHVDVTVDGELIYSLYSSDEQMDGDIVGKSISSNWCIIPLEPEDAGKRFTVMLTPLIDDILPKNVEFLIGSNYNIILNQLRNDAPRLILAMMCIALGLIIFLIQCYLQIFSGTSQWDQIFLGVFSMILGVWRITDVRSAPLIFAGNPKLLGYVSVGMVFLASPALIQFVSTYFREKQAHMVHILAIIISSVGLITLMSQVLRQTDMGETRILSYTALCVAMVTVVIASFHSRKNKTESRNQLAWKLLPLLAVGIFLDFHFYFNRRNSTELIYSCLFFLIYLSITFIAGFQETSKMVYRDGRTGLFNKARWNELMQSDSGMEMNVAILVVDMNGLKKVNDTMGHEAGDRMICAFADILNSALPSSCVICRWGGDEFTVLLPKVNREKLTRYMDALSHATDEYNATDPEVKLYYAIGEALWEEHPEMSRMDLFRLADENMYRNKQQWYAERKKQ